jgi:membrane protein DedA with SNARE-associated domain
MEHTSLSDALISLIPTYGPWIIFGIVALESADVPLPGETILVAAALLAATTGQISIVVVVLASAGGAIVGDGIGYMVGRRFGLLLIRRYGRMAAHGAKRPFVLGMNWRPKIWVGPWMQHICNTTNLSY